jgi:DNA mismatch repair protein MutS2
MAIVERLLASGATVAATTHYAELKAFAQEHALVTNASVAFDVATLRPTYRLEIGLPGKSQAFAIAQRLGLPAEILEDARSRLAAEHVSMEETLAAIGRAESERTLELERAREEREAAEGDRERSRSGVARARGEAAQMLADARRAADEILSRAEREVEEVRRELTRQRNLRGARGSGAPAKAAFDALTERAVQARSEAAGAELATDEANVQPRVGLWGRSRTLGSAGRIVDVSGRTGRVTLETDGARIVIPGDDVEVVAEPIAGPTPRDEELAELKRRAAGRIAPRLDLRGERVEAALEQLTAYLDEALLAGLDEAVIVHGAGTGALRRSIREYLAEHPRVRSTRPGRREEGGDGATVAEL